MQRNLFYIVAIIFLTITFASCQKDKEDIAVTDVTLNTSVLTLTIGDKETLKATITPSDATDKSIIWISSNTRVATVNDKGEVSAVSVGDAVITVVTNDGGRLDICDVKVSRASVTLDKTVLVLSPGEKETVKATVVPATKSLTWTSDKTSVATVSATGEVTAVASGDATITVATSDGGQATTCVVKVTKKMIINLSPKTGFVTFNMSGSGKATILWGNGKSETITLTSSPSGYGHTYTEAISNPIIIGGENIYYFSITGQPLTSIDISKNAALTSLSCNDTKLTSLNLSNNTTLDYLYFYNNQLLTSIDVSGCTALKTFGCTNSQLTSINIKGCTTLAYFYCYRNQLTDVNIKGFTTLITVDCSYNKLTSLDVSGCAALNEFSGNNNQLTSVNVTGTPVLKYLRYYDNNLSTEALNTAIDMLHSNYIPGKVFSIANNPGANSCNQSLAKDKGWSIQ